MRWADRSARVLLEAPPSCSKRIPTNSISLCQREAGKTLMDGVLEVREAVDFLRYLRGRGARACSIAPSLLPGPDGRGKPTDRMAGRGVFATISPWNFPLAIFIGPAAAALAAGNTVVAKPAEQTPLIAALAVKLCHDAGIPREVFQLLPGRGRCRREDHLRPAVSPGWPSPARPTPRKQSTAPGLARRTDRHLHRRNRRAERDDRRQLGAARAGYARRDRLCIPERGSALFGAARAVSAGGCRRRNAGDDPRRLRGADDRRPRAALRPMSAR